MTQIIAHRGARSVAPENTIAAAEKAWQIGADLWETDLAVTLDEQIILFHDHSLERTTDVKRLFPHKDSFIYTDYTLEEIRSLDTGSIYIKKDPFGEIKKGTLAKEEVLSLKGEKVPTLEEALLFTKEKSWRVNLELKRLPEKFKGFPMVQSVMAMIKKINIDPDAITLSSFNHTWLEIAGDMEPGIDIQALIGISQTDPLDWGDYSFETYNARSTLIDEKQIQTAIKKGRKINLFTVNETGEMKAFMDQGVDGIITDYPQRLKALIEKKRTLF